MQLDLNNFDVATPYNQLWIVERILPKSTYSHKLVDWVVGETPCLAVGKIKGMRPNKDFIGNQLERKSVGLSPREIEIIQPQLVHFYADRGLANWAYTEQDGSQTPLRELALNLTQA